MGWPVWVSLSCQKKWDVHTKNQAQVFVDPTLTHVVELEERFKNLLVAIGVTRPGDQVGLVIKMNPVKALRRVGSLLVEPDHRVDDGQR